MFFLILETCARKRERDVREGDREREEYGWCILRRSISSSSEGEELGCCMLCSVAYILCSLPHRYYSYSAT